MMHTKLLRLLALLFAVSLVAAACGGSDDGSDNAGGDAETEESAGDSDDGGDDDGGDDEEVTVSQGGTLGAVQGAGELQCGGNDTLSLIHI